MDIVDWLAVKHTNWLNSNVGYGVNHLLTTMVTPKIALLDLISLFGWSGPLVKNNFPMNYNSN